MFKASIDTAMVPCMRIPVPIFLCDVHNSRALAPSHNMDCLLNWCSSSVSYLVGRVPDLELMRTMKAFVASYMRNIVVFKTTRSTNVEEGVSVASVKEGLGVHADCTVMRASFFDCSEQIGFYSMPFRCCEEIQEGDMFAHGDDSFILCVVKNSILVCEDGSDEFEVISVPKDTSPYDMLVSRYPGDTFETSRRTEVGVGDDLFNPPLVYRVSNAAPPQAVDIRNRDEVEEAFECTYRDLFGTVKKFLRHLERELGKYTSAPSKYHSPYVSLVQSSGWGKSRLLVEAHIQGKTKIGRDCYLLYTCLRPTNSTGYPLRSLWCDLLYAADMSKRICDDVIETMRVNMIKIILAGVMCYVQDKGAVDFITGTERVSETLVIFTGWRPTTMKEGMDFVFARLGDETLTPIGDKRVRKEAIKEERERLKRIRDNLKSALFIFSVDEAGHFLRSFSKDGLNLFRCFRRASRLVFDFVKPELSLMFVVTDTMGKMMNFAPEAMRDSSYRYSNDGERELLEPFYDIGSFNSIQEPTMPEELSLRSLVDVRNDDENRDASYLRCGRPLWGVNGRLNDHEMLRYGRIKLLGGYERFELVPVEPRRKRAACACAIWANRITLTIDSQNIQSTSELSGSFMGTIISVTADRSGIEVDYPYEWNLICAAHDLTQGENRHETLSQLYAALELGYMRLGDRGEVVGQLLLTLGMDRARGMCGEYVTLRSFLMGLLGGMDGSTWSGLGIDVDGMYVDFKRIMRVSQRWSLLHQLANVMAMGVAVFLPEGHRGADVVIPVFWETMGKMVYVAVQMKNRTRHCGKAVFNKLRSDFMFRGSRDEMCVLGIVLNVGPTKPREPQILTNRSGVPVIHCGGLHNRSFLFSDSISADLLKLLVRKREVGLEAKMKLAFPLREPCAGTFDVADIGEKQLKRKREDDGESGGRRERGRRRRMA